MKQLSREFESVEDKKLSVTVLLEDFKALSAQQNALQSEIHRWSTVYIASLAVAVGSLANFASSHRLADLLDSANGIDSYISLSIAAINSFYILSMVFKGYEYQQINLYLCEIIGGRIIELTGEHFCRFSEWRRFAMQGPRHFGRSEPIRFIYYFFISLLPIAVSLMLLCLFIKYDWDKYNTWNHHKLYFWMVVLLNIIAFCTSIWTTRTENRWRALMAARRRSATFKNLYKAIESSDDE